MVKFALAGATFGMAAVKHDGAHRGNIARVIEVVVTLCGDQLVSCFEHHSNVQQAVNPPVLPPPVNFAKRQLQSFTFSIPRPRLYKQFGCSGSLSSPLRLTFCGGRAQRLFVGSGSRVQNQGWR